MCLLSIKGDPSRNQSVYYLVLLYLALIIGNRDKIQGVERLEVRNRELWDCCWWTPWACNVPGLLASCKEKQHRMMLVLTELLGFDWIAAEGGVGAGQTSLVFFRVDGR